MALPGGDGELADSSLMCSRLRGEDVPVAPVPTLNGCLRRTPRSEIEPVETEFEQLFDYFSPGRRLVQTPFSPESRSSGHKI